MSALSIGRDAGGVRGNGGQTAEYLNAVVRWIPGDVLALYAAGITWIAADNDDRPSVALLIIFACATPAVVLLGVWADGRPFERMDFGRVVLGLMAYLIWSLSIPDSGWQRWSAVGDNPGWVVLISALGGVLFGLFAAGVEKRLVPAE